MSEQSLLPIAVQPVISYPREAEVGKTYLMTIDLQVVEGSEWQFEEEEYPIYCMVDSEPLFSCKAVGEPAIVLHRFGGTYDVARFTLTASKEEAANGQILVSLINGWGVPIKTISLMASCVPSTNINSVSLLPSFVKSQLTKQSSSSIRDQVISTLNSRRVDQLTHSFTKNPYTVGKPVGSTNFIGRTSEIETAFDQILSRSNLAIWGGSGIGKTSFLELLASPQAWELRGYNPSNAVIVMINCTTIKPFTAANFWKEIFLILTYKVCDDSDLQALISNYIDKGDINKDCLRTVLRELGGKDKFLILLVDDYDIALRPNEKYSDQDIAVFLSDCRNLASHSRERQFLSTVVTSSRRLNELRPELRPEGTPWYNHYLFQPLQPFREQEITLLLSGLPITPVIREEIEAITAGNPTLLQLTGFLLYQRFQVEQVLDFNAFTNDLQQLAEEHLEKIWNSFNTTEQLLLISVAIAGLLEKLPSEYFSLESADIGDAFSRNEQELQALGDRFIIKYESKLAYRSYRFTSSMMEWWVLRKIQTRSEEILKRNQKVFLDLIGHQLTEKLMVVIRELQQHQESMLLFSEWSERLLESLLDSNNLGEANRVGLLTDAQQQLYDWLSIYVSQNQHAPSIRQMMVAMRKESPAPIQFLLEQLRNKRYIDWTEGQARTIRLLPNLLLGLPIRGSVAATSLVEIHENVEYISFPTSIIKSQCFALRVRGHGMIEALIDDGDIVIMQPMPSFEMLKDGVIVAAHSEGKAMIAHFCLRGNKVMLQLANSNKNLYPTIEVAADRVEIQGILVAVWRGYNI